MYTRMLIAALHRDDDVDHEVLWWRSVELPSAGHRVTAVI